MQVEMTRTEYTPAGMAALLIPALRKGLGAEPTRNLQELTLAQLCFETTSGHNVWNYNFGNVDVSSSEQNYWMAPGQPNHIRAFNNAREGMAEYVHQVIRRPSLVKAGDAGDALAFATAIRDTKYTPSIDPEQVAKTLSKFVSDFRTQKILTRVASTAAAATMVVIGLVATAGILTLAIVLGRRRVHA